MKYAIFDLDGTITDSMDYWRNFGKYYLIENGLVNAGEMIEIEHISGTKWVEDLCDYIEKTYNVSLTPDEFMSWGLSFMRKRYGEYVGFKPGAKELLDTLQKQGVKMCICSSTDKELMQPALDKLDLEKYFRFTLHCRQFGKEKNNPDTFRYCMEQLGAEKPEEVAVFEDALYSAETAKKMGFYTVGMYDATEPNREKMMSVCDQYVTDYSQLDYSKLPE